MIRVRSVAQRSDEDEDAQMRAGQLSRARTVKHATDQRVADELEVLEIGKKAKDAGYVEVGLILVDALVVNLEGRADATDAWADRETLPKRNERRERPELDLGEA